jgi:hypothetical protein
MERKKPVITCDGCRFLHKLKSGPSFCRRHAPNPSVISNQIETTTGRQGLTFWPRVIATLDWCGEFKKKGKA